MNDIFSSEDIDTLYTIIEESGMHPSNFVDIKPSDLNEIPDEKLRHRMKEKYVIAEKYYFGRIEKLLEFHSHQIGKYLIPYRPEDDLTIKEKLSRLSSELIKLGYTVDQIWRVVPQTVEDLKNFTEDKTATESRGR